MAVTQMQLLIAGFAGFSLFLHLCSAGNFIPTSEIGFFGSIFGFVHALCNVIARLSLFSVCAVIATRHYQPNLIQSRINYRTTINYTMKLMLTALLSTAFRVVLPGPVTYFSKLYKLSILSLLIGTVSSVLDYNSRGSPTLTRQVPWRKNREPSKNKESDKTVNRNSSSSSGSSDVSYIPTKRHRTAMELLQTETSYLKNLNTLIKVYKEPLEQAVSDGKPLLDAKDIQNVFGGLPDIAKLHIQIHQDLSDLIDNWDEDCCIANVITKYQDNLLKVYPPYVNYFDMSKETLMKKEKSNVDLKEFFLNCFHEPQSLKQPLDALLIRPVQRLPSISLLIGDLLKRTPEGLEDHTKLEEAKGVLKKVLSHINEDKRKTEGKMKIFDIVYEVDGCPVEVVSSNRLFIFRVDASTLNDGLYRSGERLALYLLSDVIEVAKWRNRSHGKAAPLLKHVELLSLNNIVKVLDVTDSDECKNMFGIKYIAADNSLIDNVNGNAEERLSVLQLIDDRTFKAAWLKALVRQIKEVKGENTDVIEKIDPVTLSALIKRGSKLFKKLRSFSKNSKE